MLSVIQQSLRRIIGEVSASIPHKLNIGTNTVSKHFQCVQQQPSQTFCIAPSVTATSLHNFKSQQIHNGYSKEENTNCHFLKVKNGSLLNYQSVRYKVRVYYRPSAHKRIHKHGLEKRLSTRGGREILWRRLLKDRHHLTVFDQFLAPLPPMSKKRRKELGLDAMAKPKKFYTHESWNRNKY